MSDEATRPIRPMSKGDARQVADLHHSAIATGFLSSLGPAFLRQLYAAVPSAPCGFGFVCQGPDGRVLGFVACAESTGRLYKQALLRRGVLMAMPLVRFLLRPSVIRQIIQTLRYPSEVGQDLPAAEVLSIVVSSDAQGKGIGRALIEAALREFRLRSIARVKVAVWAGNKAANAFYARCGFAFALARDHHGLPMNIYVGQTGLPD